MYFLQLQNAIELHFRCCYLKLIYKHARNWNLFISHRIKRFFLLNKPKITFLGPWPITFNFLAENCFDTMHLVLETCHLSERRFFKGKFCLKKVKLNSWGPWPQKMKIMNFSWTIFFHWSDMFPKPNALYQNNVLQKIWN